MRKYSCAGAIDVFLGLTGLITILLTTWSVVCRFVLQTSIMWSDELLRTVFVWAYFIGSAMLCRSNGLMRLELLDDFFQRKGKRNALRVVCVLQELGMLIFSGIIAYYSIFMVYTQVVSKQLTTTSGTPAWVLTLGFMIGMCLCTLFSLEKLSILILDKPQNGALLNEGKGK